MVLKYGFDSATGVAFTARFPAHGREHLYGEYLVNAQGEDVVAGIRTPKPVQRHEEGNAENLSGTRAVRKNWKKHFHEVQDFEFTVEKGKLYILQTRMER